MAPDSDSDICSSVPLRNYPSISARRVSRIHVHLCDVLLDVEVGDEILYVCSDRVGTCVCSFWKTGSLRSFTWIAVGGDDNISMDSLFPGSSDPASLIIGEVVCLGIDVDMSPLASGD